MEFLGENPREDIEGKVDCANTCRAMGIRHQGRAERGDIPSVVSIRMLRK
jgi:hypothetical protein